MNKYTRIIIINSIFRDLSFDSLIAIRDNSDITVNSLRKIGSQHLLRRCLMDEPALVSIAAKSLNEETARFRLNSVAIAIIGEPSTASTPVTAEQKYR